MVIQAIYEEEGAMSNLANPEVLDVGNHALRAGFRKALENAVIDVAIDKFGADREAFRSFLEGGFQGIGMMSDATLLHYASIDIGLGEVEGQVLTELSEALSEIDWREDHGYRVIWEIDVNGPNPEQAARRARDLMRARASTANVFEVRHREVPEELSVIDLQRLDLERDAEASREVSVTDVNMPELS
jgi:hypothetical protein